jgi:hypothetical protein
LLDRRRLADVVHARGQGGSGIGRLLGRQGRAGQLDGDKPQRIIERGGNPMHQARQSPGQENGLEPRRHGHDGPAARGAFEHESIFLPAARDVMLAGFAAALDNLACQQSPILPQQINHAFLGPVLARQQRDKSGAALQLQRRVECQFEQFLKPLQRRLDERQMINHLGADPALFQVCQASARAR